MSNTTEQLAEYVRLHPDTSAVEAVAAADANPSVWVEVVADALDTVDPVAALRQAEPDSEEAGSTGVNPTPDGGETTIQDGEAADENGSDDSDDSVDREAAVAALADVLRFYNSRLDDEITDHTGAGEHPERPTTAREYFTEVRGWNDATVDDLLLGWAPPDHVDQLVAYLHDRGHSRAAMLATGAIGEADSGGLYATFSARYVLPYYDAAGEPAYAIARCTGGDGGGARGYGGHPDDYQAGKYAKLRHTDDRVPFDEPIYGLDTLDENDHVVVAEGIADAITAREAGHAVLSPVAKEFKNDHLAPLADALDSHGIGRVTIVADADSIRNDTTADAAPESIGDAVGTALSPTGAGLAGALRTASKLGDRSEADLRVTVPPAPADTESDLDEFVTGAWRGDLDALLRSAKPPESFDEWDTVSSEPDASAEEYADFDAEEYDATATEADETTDEIRDVYAALDDLDAQRVAEKTIVAEWLEGRADHRTFRPTWAPSDYSGTAVYCDGEKFVDTGSRGGYGGPAVMAAIDADLVSDTQCPDAVSGETWVKAVDHLRDDLGFSIPQLDDGGEQHRTDPRDRVATVDMRRAWDAAGRVTPDELETGLDLPTSDDGEAWLADGDRIGDVVRAVALAEGRIADADDDLDDYPAAYNTARETYGAPLPRYYTTADAVAEFDAVLDVIGEVTFWDIDTDALNSEVTAEGEAVDGDAVRAIDPSWRESESGESVLVFDNGTVWDADSERVIDALRLVALDSGLIESPTEPLEGESFTTAYNRARAEYGAPLPRWEPATDGSRQLTPQLPAADQLVDAFDFDGVDDDALAEARQEVEELIADRLADADEPTVVTSLPATGKTTGTIKTADHRPLSYLAPRKELQKQALEKADRWNVDAEVLPVFSDEQVREEILDAAVSHVRSGGKDRLRDRWGVLTTALAAAGDDSDAPDADDLFAEPDDDSDEVDLDRPTCETARGDHGPAWALAVHVARRLGYTPREIHQQAGGLFGAALPCEHGDGESCEYSDGWQRVTDADDPAELLVGSYIHAHVESVRTYYDSGGDGEVERTPRAVVLDEFPGDAYTREFGTEAVDHATWLARSLVEEVEDRRDMRAADLHTDEWVRAWLDGRGEEIIPTTVRTLERFAALFDARAAAEEIADTVADRTLDALDLAEPLAAVRYDDAADAFESVAAAVDAVAPEQPAAGVARWVDDAVRQPLAVATVEGTSEPSVDAVGSDQLPESGDLRGLLDRALDAVQDGSTDAPAAVDAALSAVRGGREGCRRLAAWADDGYAHPDAHHLLTADITPTGDAADDDQALADARRIHTDSWAFDDAATDGTTLDYVETGEKSTVVADRNDHGAILHTPPSRDAGGGGEVPIVGLDATGRAELWQTALGEPVRTADVHTTPEQRAEFLESALSLRVIQASDLPRPYEGDPASKDTDGDVSLLEGLADEYSGIEAPRSRDDAVDAVGKPAAITTKGVREVLESDSRLDDVVAEWENYGNITGANDLGDHRLAAILGSQHYGDDAIERFCALAGEEVDTDRSGGRGAALDYDSDLANTYLKHMRDDQTMQAILRFARGGSGATVVARTSALRADLPVIGRGQVVETWSDTATKIARRYRRLGGEFTVADVATAVDVTKRQVRRVLGELVEAGYLRRVSEADGQASTFEPAAASQPGAGEVELPERSEAVAAEPGRSPHNQYYTWNVRVWRVTEADSPLERADHAGTLGAPPAPATVEADPPPG